VAERSFVLRRRSGAVPGVLWSPGTSRLCCSVTAEVGTSAATATSGWAWLAARAGLAVVAIDGPTTVTGPHVRRIPPSTRAWSLTRALRAPRPGWRSNGWRPSAWTPPPRH